MQLCMLFAEPMIEDDAQLLCPGVNIFVRFVILYLHLSNVNTNVSYVNNLHHNYFLAYQLIKNNFSCFYLFRTNEEEIHK